MKVYYDDDPVRSFMVSNEYHRIEHAKVTLNYIPLTDSVTITGFTRTNSITPRAGEFYVDERDEQCAIATPEVYFNEADNGKHINVGYRGRRLVLELKGVSALKNRIANRKVESGHQRQGSVNTDISVLFRNDGAQQSSASDKSVACSCSTVDTQPITIEDIRSLFG